MENVNKQLLDALKEAVRLIAELSIAATGCEVTEERIDKVVRIARDGSAVQRFRDMIAAAEQAQQATAQDCTFTDSAEIGVRVGSQQQVELSQEWLDYLIEDVSAIDCMYRGDPMYEHDAYWMKDRVIKMLEKRRDAAKKTVVPVPTIKLGLYGRELDTLQTRRAYTYREQPDNIGANKLGRAVLRAASGGDNIDYGLSLLQQLQAEGFGVFELGDQQKGGA